MSDTAKEIGELNMRVWELMQDNAELQERHKTLSKIHHVVQDHLEGLRADKVRVKPHTCGI